MCMRERCNRGFWGYDLFWFVFVLIFITWVFQSLFISQKHASRRHVFRLFLYLFLTFTFTFTHSRTVMCFTNFSFGATIRRYFHIECHLLTQYQSVSILTNFDFVVAAAFDIYFAFIDKFWFLCRLSADFALNVCCEIRDSCSDELLPEFKRQSRTMLKINKW